MNGIIIPTGIISVTEIEREECVADYGGVSAVNCGRVIYSSVPFPNCINPTHDTIFLRNAYVALKFLNARWMEPCLYNEKMMILASLKVIAKVCVSPKP